MSHNTVKNLNRLFFLTERYKWVSESILVRVLDNYIYWGIGYSSTNPIKLSTAKTCFEFSIYPIEFCYNDFLNCLAKFEYKYATDFVLQSDIFLFMTVMLYI